VLVVVDSGDKNEWSTASYVTSEFDTIAELAGGAARGKIFGAGAVPLRVADSFLNLGFGWDGGRSTCSNLVLLEYSLKADLPHELLLFILSPARGRHSSYRLSSLKRWWSKWMKVDKANTSFTAGTFSESIDL